MSQTVAVGQVLPGRDRTESHRHSRPHQRPWHRGSVHGAGPRRPLDRNARARFRFLLDQHARNRRPGGVTRTGQAIGLVLLRSLAEDGRCDPSHDYLAEQVGCSDRTVRRQLGAMADAGLLTWQRRIVAAGWRAEQTSNAYLLNHAAETAPFRVKPSTWRVESLIDQCESGFTDDLSAAEQKAVADAAGDILVTIRKRRESVIAADWQARSRQPLQNKNRRS
jgi:hypothetical protein